MILMSILFLRCEKKSLGHSEYSVRLRFPVQGLHSGRDLGASNLKYSMKEEENAPTAMCSKRLAKLDSQLTTHSVNEHVTPVKLFKNFLFPVTYSK